MFGGISTQILSNNKAWTFEIADYEEDISLTVLSKQTSQTKEWINYKLIYFMLYEEILRKIFAVKKLKDEHHK